MLICVFVVIISQCMHISKHQVIHLKCIQFLFIIYTSIKLGGEKGKKMEFVRSSSLSVDDVNNVYQ